jgi:nicotinate phosphoribosyltransferase
VGQFVAAGAPVDSFGVGMSIAAAPPIGFTADIKEVDGEPRTKRGRIPGVTATPRLQRVV